MDKALQLAQESGVDQLERYDPWPNVDVMQTLVIALQENMPDWVTTPWTASIVAAAVIVRV